MNTCFLCGHVMVPCVPPACGNASLQRAFEAMQQATNRNQPVRVADYTVRLIPQHNICLIEEQYDPENPKVSLTNSIETAIVQVCQKHGLCPDRWTFVEHASGGTAQKAYHEYDMIVLANGDVEWKYIWHNDAHGDDETYSDELLTRRVNQLRNGATNIH